MDPIVLIPISILFLAGMILGRNEIVQRKLPCPRNGRTADVELLRRSLRPSKVVGIKSCNLLSDPKKVLCGQDCLKVGAPH